MRLRLIASSNQISYLSCRCSKSSHDTLVYDSNKIRTFNTFMSKNVLPSIFSNCANPQIQSADLPMKLSDKKPSSNSETVDDD